MAGDSSRIQNGAARLRREDCSRDFGSLGLREWLQVCFSFVVIGFVFFFVYVYLGFFQDYVQDYCLLVLLFAVSYPVLRKFQEKLLCLFRYRGLKFF